jgi:hypothetical protein
MRDELGIKLGDDFDSVIAEKGKLAVTRRSDGLTFMLAARDKKAA